MPQRKHRFQAPPSQDPLSGAKSSLVFRLNFGFFFRQLVIFLVMDLLLLFMATAGLFLYAENRCATVAALVEERGVPSAERPLRRYHPLDGGQRLHHCPSGDRRLG